jgi:S1-C subfamily serine protease
MRQLVRLACAGFVLLFTSAALRQQGAPPSQTQAPQPAAKRDWREVWRNATVAFGEIAHDTMMNHDFFHALGTGVIITTGAHTGYLVTARHMFCDTEKGVHPAQLQLRFAWQEHKSIYDYLGGPLPLRSSSGANLWSSSDDGSDIAAIPMPSPDSVLPPEDRLKTYDAVPMEDVVSDIYEGETVLVFGYPGIVGNEKLVRAIVRQGIVAWTNPNQPDEKTFLVDANLYPGNSGGPVIKFPVGLQKDGSVDYIRGGSLKLLGIVSQAPTVDIKTTVVNPRLGPVETHTEITGIGAIGFIEPGSKIRKLIEAMQKGTAKASVCDVPEPVQKQPTAAQTPK